MARRNVDIIMELEGFEELQNQFARLGQKFPKKDITASAKAGIKYPLEEAKANMKVGKTGLLKKGLKAVMEKTRNRRSKTVYRLMWSDKYTEYYLKEGGGGKYGGEDPAYYPHSIEYGWKTAYGKHEGYFIGKRAVEKTSKASAQAVVKNLEKAINRLTR
jgi:hypothetical protein